MQVPVPRKKLSYPTRNECLLFSSPTVLHSQYWECILLSMAFIKKKLFPFITVQTCILEVSLLNTAVRLPSGASMYLYPTAWLGVFFSIVKYTWLNMLLRSEGEKEVGEEHSTVSQCMLVWAHFLLSMGKVHFKHRLLHIWANSAGNKDEQNT